MIFSGSGGGSPLNFKVVGGTTAPANPRENTVFLQTDVPIDGYTFSATEPQPVSKNSNLLLYPFSQTTSTHNGVTFTDNGDGTITANGKATGDAYFYLINNNKTMAAEGGTYTLTGCPKGGSASTYIVRVYDNLTGSYWEDTGSGRTRELSAGGVLDLVCFIRVKSGATVSNLVFKPQFEKGSAATSFVKGDATGQVWITMALSGAAKMNILKKNTLEICLASGFQYINGAWVKKPVEVYSNGKWNSGRIVFHDASADLTISGGYSITQREEVGWSNVTIEADGSIKSYTKEGATSMWFSNKAVDLTPYSTISFTFQGKSTTGNYANTSRLGVAKTRGTSFESYVSTDKDGTVTVKLDVTSLTGMYYIGGRGSTKSGYANNFYVYDIIIE